LDLNLENVWQRKDLQTRFLDVWQGKDLRARFSDVWQGKDLAWDRPKYFRANAPMSRRKSVVFFLGLLGELGETDLQTRFLDVWQGKDLRDFCRWAGKWRDAGRRTGSVARATKRFSQRFRILSSNIIVEMVAVRTGW